MGNNTAKLIPLAMLMEETHYWQVQGTRIVCGESGDLNPSVKARLISPVLTRTTKTMLPFSILHHE